MSITERYGREDGRSIVFLHGAGGNLGIWTPQYERLGTEYRCVGIDLPGHGRNDAVRFSLDRAVDDVLDGVAATTNDKVVLVGHSLGAYVAIAVVLKRPSAVRGLVISGAGYQFTGVTGVVNRIQGIVFPALAPFLRRKALESLGRIAPPGVIEAMEARGGFTLRGAGQALRGLAGWRVHGKLAAYSGPVLALMGERDRPNIEALPRLTDGVASLQAVILEDAGHSSCLTQPQAFCEAVDGFISGVVFG